MRYISSSKLASDLNITEAYLFKMFNSCGFMKRSSYSINHIKFVCDNLSVSNYRRKVIVSKLDYFIQFYKDNYL